MTDQAPALTLRNDNDAATTLTAEQIDELRTAARQSGPFVSPSAMHYVSQTPFYPEWAAAIIGRRFPGVRWVAPWEITLLSLALNAEPNRPTPAAVTAGLEEARAKTKAYNQAAAKAYSAKLDAWHALRDRLPITVTVGHNWTIGHYDGHTAGKDHIVAQKDLHVGRLHRNAKQVLCETPAKKVSGRRNKDPLRGVDRDDDGEDRIPTCKPCLKLAERIASA
ncbi:MAG: hypothetical protein ABR585_07495 [Gemmatimonadaceae bacterium]